MKQTYSAAGFAARNLGIIEDSYTRMKLRSRAHVHCSGFVSENTGKIIRSYSDCKITGYERFAGFRVKNSGEIESSFWIDRRHPESRRLSDKTHWINTDFARKPSEIGEAFLNDWDLDTVWMLVNEETDEIMLNLYDPRPVVRADKKQIEIETVPEFLEMIEKINLGDYDRDVVVVLKNDLDLSGKYITPMGIDSDTAFEAEFDGQGHLIKNFKIDVSKYHYAGIFGFIGEKGIVRNLRVDGILSGRGDVVGAIAGCNDGLIENCTSSSLLYYSRLLGGFVSINRGVIRRCSCFGTETSMAAFPWWSIPAAIFAIAVLIPAFLSISARNAGTEIFAPVIVDPNAKPVEPDQTMAEASSGQSEQADTGAGFIMNTELLLNAENQSGELGLTCPSSSKRGMIARIFISKEALSKAGISVQQSSVTLYESGLLKPGYGIQMVTLSGISGGLKPGKYSCSVQLDFYDVKTNEKSAVNTTVPLDVTVS